MDTSEIIKSLDALRGDIEADGDPIQRRLSDLGDSRIPLLATDGLTRGFLDLERASSQIARQRRLPLLRIHEACGLVRLNGELVNADTLLLADLERTHSRVVGPAGTGLRALRALRALDDPLTPSLETALMHLDRDVAEWPEDRTVDPRARAIAELATDIEAVLAAPGPALARLAEAHRLALAAELPEHAVAGAAPDPAQGFTGDDENWVRHLNVHVDDDSRQMMAAVALIHGAQAVGWTAGHGLCVAQDLRALPCPADASPRGRLQWMARVLLLAAERTRRRTATLALAVQRLETAADGYRDRARSRLTAALCARPLTTAAALAGDAGVSRMAAHRYLKRLVDAQLCRWRSSRSSGRVALIATLAGE